jgi:hypothetical protein
MLLSNDCRRRNLIPLCLVYDTLLEECGQRESPVNTTVDFLQYLWVQLPNHNGAEADGLSLHFGWLEASVAIRFPYVSIDVP